ncbi:streptophobe family protein [Streptomyces boninensis]|uniref:streptophobe family protein n=1 Tax=Streptomyces boninensis TaxID=2039455 RepID=UPI003B221E33
MSQGSDDTRTRIPWGSVFASALASVSWAFLVMAGLTALGLHLLGADALGELGPMTAAAMVLATGGAVRPDGDMKAFGMEESMANASIDLAPLGISFAGALILGWFFVRSLRGAGPFISRGELAARAGSVIVLFVAMVGGLAWAGSGAVTIDGKHLPMDKIPGGGGGGLPDAIKDKLPDGIGDIGGGLPDAIGDLANAKAQVGFEVLTGRSLLGGLIWVVLVLTIALAASRKSPLPHGWEAAHRVVRPAASALRFVVVLAVCAGLAAAAYSAATEEAHGQIAGAAILGAPNGVWLALPLGLFVPWHGSVTGQLKQVLPDPMDKLLTGDDKPITVGRLAELDNRVWLLAVATAMMMLAAGVLTAVRTPVRDERGALQFAARCAVRLGVITGLTLPLLAWLTGVSADASMSVFGVDALGAGLELHGSILWALLLGVVWGAGAGAVGALAAWWSGSAGERAAPLARGAARVGTEASDSGRTYPSIAYQPGPYNPAKGYRPEGERNPYTEQPPPTEISRPPAGGAYNAPTIGAAVPPPPPPGKRRRRQQPRWGTPDGDGPPPPGPPRGPRKRP